MKMRKETLDHILVADGRRACKRLAPQAGELVLDLGAHIGGFAVPAAQAGATIVAVEAHPANFQMLVANTHGLSVECTHAAVVDDPSERVLLFEHPGRNTGQHSVRLNSSTKSTIEIPVIGIGALYARRPSAMKIDIEGEEYWIFSKPVPECIERLFVEWTMYRKSWRAAALEQHEYLHSQGFTSYYTRKWSSRNQEVLYVRS